MSGANSRFARLLRPRTRVSLIAAATLVAGLLSLSAAPASAEDASDLGFTFGATPTGSNADRWIAGQDVTLTAVVTNYGPDAAPDNTVTIGIPNGTDYISDDADCVEGASVLTCAGGGLALNEPRTINVTIHVHPDVADGADLAPVNAFVQTTGSEGDDTNTNNGTIDPANVHRVANLSIVKSGPDGVSPIVVAGDPSGFDYAITVDSAGPSDGDFLVHDTLMDGLTFVSSDAGCSAINQEVSCGGSISPDDSAVVITIHVLVAASVGGGSILTNDATVELGPGAGEDPSLSNNTTEGSSTVSTSVTAQADLGITVDATNGDNVAGDPAGVDFVYTVSNGGPSNNVGGFTVTDTLPDGFSFAASGSDAVCDGSSGIAISCDDSTDFPAGDPDRTITVHAKIASSVLPDSYSDLATVTSNETTDPNGANDTDSDSVDVVNEADLTPTVTFGSGPFTAGGTSFSGSVRVDNNGHSDNHGGYSVNVPLPTGIVFVSGDSGCVTVTGGFTCSDSTGLAADTNNTQAVTLRALSSAVASPPSYDLTGTVSSLGTDDPDADNNTSTATFAIITRADLSLTTAAITYPTGQTAAFANTDPMKNFAIYEYDVTNNGPSDAQSVSFNDTLPTGVTFAGACFGGAGCIPNQSLPLSIGTLNGNDGSPANQSKHIRVKVTANANLRNGPLTKTDSASVTSATTDPGPSLNARSENATVWTVPSTPTDPDARPGNTNAFFLWKQVLSSNGGAAIDKFAVDVTGTGAPAVPDVLVGDACGTSNNQQVFCTGVSPLTNGVTYTFVVTSHNVVGFSDPTTGVTAMPSIDASAQQIKNGSLSQHTGNATLPSKTDQQISFQDFPSNTTGIGTVLETNQGAALFCGGGPCVGKIVKTKLQDPFLPGIYQITLLYDKTLVGGTGQKYTFFYAPTDTATTGNALVACPKTVTANAVPCVKSKLASGGANPALKAIIYTNNPDPTIGGRAYPKQ